MQLAADHDGIELRAFEIARSTKSRPGIERAIAGHIRKEDA